MSTAEEQIAAEMTPDEDEQGEEAEQEETPDVPEQEEAAPDEEAAPPRSQKEIDAVQDKLKAEAARHEKAVAKIMGEDFGFLVPNPTDWTPGFIFNVPAMHPMPEQVAALYAILGEAPPTDYPDDPGRQTCDMCRGTTKLKTGSLDPVESALPCRFCQGHGWTGEGNPKIEPIHIPPPPVFQNGSGQAPNQFQVADRWGRPSGHPHYNIEPANVGV